MQKGRKGQVAIFVIIAILIVIGIAIFFLYRNQIGPEREGSEIFSPESYLKSCIEPYVKSSLAIQEKQGGFAAPEQFLEYNGEKIAYLCYTNQYYKTCVVQNPMIKAQIEQELKKAVLPKMTDCIKNLVDEYISRGYQAEAGSVQSDVSIVPGKIALSFRAPLAITKESLTQKFDRFDINIRSEIYDILLISENIVNYESQFGDSEITSYMQYYPDIKIDKNKIGDGSKIYTVSNIVTNESFRFASRSLVWPPGYGVN